VFGNEYTVQESSLLKLIQRQLNTNLTLRDVNFLNFFIWEEFDQEINWSERFRE